MNLSLLSSPKKIAGIILVTSMLTLIFFQRSEIAFLNDRIIELVKSEQQARDDVDTLKNNVEQAVKVNKLNQETIRKLTSDRKATEAALKKLSQEAADNKSQLADLEALINSSSPADDGPVAPVLKNVIDAIQENAKESK